MFSKSIYRSIQTTFNYQIRNSTNVFTSLRFLSLKPETTPNPDTMKFTTDPKKNILPEEFGQSFRVTDRIVGKKTPLGLDLYNINGVKGVMLGSDYVTITKKSSSSWDAITKEAERILDKYLSSTGKTIIYKDHEQFYHPNDIKPEDSRVVALIKEIIQTRIRPRIQQDGGDILFDSFTEDQGLVKIKMIGACEGCPSSALTLKHSVEKMLMHYIPEVQEVISIDPSGNPEPSLSQEDIDFQTQFDQELQKVIEEELAAQRKKKEEKM
ncbi:hypothetical protein WA158_008404 [Blastocystis sp. Blastoise]